MVNITLRVLSKPDVDTLSLIFKVQTYEESLLHYPTVTVLSVQHWAQTSSLSNLPCFDAQCAGRFVHALPYRCRTWARIGTSVCCRPSATRS